MNNGLLFKRLIKCDICNNRYEYKGLGEYYCPHCDKTIYDDYGTVRNYVEQHPLATIKEISAATGVRVDQIREFVDQDKFIEIRR